MLPDKSYWLIRDCIIFSFQKKYAVVQAGVYEYSILESVLMQHVIGILKADFKDDLSVLSKVMVLLFYVFCLVGLPLISYILFF